MTRWGLGLAACLAIAGLVGVALTSAGWRLALAGLSVVSAGAFGGLLDGEGRAPRRTVLLLGMLTYLVIVPVLGFASHGLLQLRGTSRGWWAMAAIVASGFLAAFYGARRWRLGRAR